MVQEYMLIHVVIKVLINNILTPVFYPRTGNKTNQQVSQIESGTKTVAISIYHKSIMTQFRSFSKILAINSPRF